MRDFGKIFPYLWAYKKYIIVVLVFSLLTAFFSAISVTMLLPFLSIIFGTTEAVTASVPFELTQDALLHNMKYLVSEIVERYGADGKMYALMYVAAAMLVLTLLKVTTEYLGQYFEAPVMNGVPRDIYNKAYAKLLELPVSFYSEEKKGDIMSRLTTDITEVRQSMISSFSGYIKMPIQIIVYFIVLLTISYKMTLVILIILPVGAFLSGKIGKSLKKTSKALQSLIGSISVIIEETISGLKVIKAFDGDNYMTQKFRKHTHQFAKMMNNVNRKQRLSSPISELIGIISVSVALLYGGKMVISGEFDGSTLLTYLFLFVQIIHPAKTLSMSYYNVKKGVASLERINEILDTKVIIEDKPDAKSLLEFKSEIEFRNVSFAYETKQVLKNVSFTLHKGQTIALVGQSGSGKTTIVNLLPRFYDISQGDILIDGVSIKDYKLADLRKQIGIVTQESLLFNDTIANNISFGVDDASKEKVSEAARIANAEEFILQKDKGFDTNIGDGGSKLSGGQKQRMCIARAIMKNPPILILDEATSALDTESERLVQDALEKLMMNRTSLVIAHRLSTIKHADLILVMHEGQIVERGTHEELIQKNGTYRKLHDLQLL